MTPNIHSNTHPSEGELRGRTPLKSDARLQAVLSRLLGRATQRQVWLTFLDERQCFSDPIMPMNDHPTDPEELHETEDLGLVTFPYIFVSRARYIAEMCEARSYVIIWERLGGSRFTPDDLTWTREFVQQANGYSDGAHLRAVFLMHERGLRPITPDDYA